MAPCRNNVRVQDAVENAWQQLGVSTTIDELEYQNLAELWRDAIARHADSKAFTCLGYSISYRKLDSLSDQFAAFLQNDLNLVPGDRIAIQMPNLCQYPVVVLAAMKIGLVIVNTNPMYTERELEHQFSDAGVRVVVVLDQFVATLAKAIPKTRIEHVIVTRPVDLVPMPARLLMSCALRVTGKQPALPDIKIRMFREALKGDAKYKAHRAVLEDTCVLQYTGGTTGVSKGVMLTQKNLLSNVMQTRRMLEPGPVELARETVITPLPLYHIFAFMLNFGLIPVFGWHSVLIPDPRKISAFVRTLQSVKFNIFMGLNSLFVALLHNRDFKKVDFSNLKLTISGGMALMESVAQDWKAATGCNITEGYGMTETSPVITLNPRGHERIGCAGVPVPATLVKVVDPEHGEQEVGGVGELCVKGPQIMAGYWQRPEQTAEVIVDGWMHTGDIVTVDEGGFVKIVDRLKDMILVSGFNVYPNEVEQVLTQHPDIVEAAVVGIPDERSGEVVKAFVISSNPELTAAQVIQFARQSLTGYKVPHTVEFRDSLPKSNVGKILRKELKPR